MCFFTIGQTSLLFTFLSFASRGQVRKREENKSISSFILIPTKHFSEIFTKQVILFSLYSILK